MKESIKEQSILQTVRSLCALDAHDSSFDAELVPLINAAFLILKQLAVGPREGFSIYSTAETWGDFLDDKYVEAVPSYVGTRVRINFDPPTNGSVLQALKDYVAEFEFRLNAEGEHGIVDVQS